MDILKKKNWKNPVTLLASFQIIKLGSAIKMRNSVLFPTCATS